MPNEKWIFDFLKALIFKLFGKVFLIFVLELLTAMMTEIKKSDITLFKSHHHIADNLSKNGLFILVLILERTVLCCKINVWYFCCTERLYWVHNDIEPDELHFDLGIVGCLPYDNLVPLVNWQKYWWAQIKIPVFPLMLF